MGDKLKEALIYLRDEKRIFDMTPMPYMTGLELAKYLTQYEEWKTEGKLHHIKENIKKEK